ncbi:MAG: TolC family protein [Proteobacteria bacterium]|nr:TolC family protein [Pseudomonadota bacterium]
MKRGEMGAALLLLALAALAGPAAGGNAFPLPETLGVLVDEGLANNRQIQGMRAAVRGMEDEAVAAGALDDPVIGIGLLNLPIDSFALDQEPMTQKQIFVDQKFPWFGKLGLKRQMAETAASNRDALVLARENELARMIAQTWFDLGFAHESLELNRKLSAILGQVLRVAETRYASGRGLQQDVLQAQVEESQALEEKISLEQDILTLQRRLNELLNREGFEPVSPPENLPPPRAPQAGTQELAVRALAGSPIILAARLAVAEARTGVGLAEKNYRPDTSVRLAYGQRDEDPMGRDRADFLSASVMLNVPLWKKGPILAAAKNRLLASELTLANLSSAMPHRVGGLVAEIEKALENKRLYEEALLVQAGQWADSSLDAYSVGKLEFANVLSARLRLLRFERMAANQKYMAWKKLAALEELMGGFTPAPGGPPAWEPKAAGVREGGSAMEKDSPGEERGRP